MLETKAELLSFQSWAIGCLISLLGIAVVEHLSWFAILSYGQLLSLMTLLLLCLPGLQEHLGQSQGLSRSLMLAWVLELLLGEGTQVIAKNRTAI